MDHAALLDCLRREGNALGEVPITDVDVATCPGWTLGDLVRHVGTVHRWMTAQVTADDPEQLQRIAPSETPADDAVADWYRSGLEALLDAFDHTEPGRMTPTWFGPRPSTFWARRAAHETAIHRWDSQAAITRPAPIEPAQAVDAIDELLEVLVPRRLSADNWPTPTTIHLHATDIDGEWLLALGPEGMAVTRAHAKGDVAVRGSAGDLLLMAAGRVSPARMELFGDATIIDRWHRFIAI